MPVTISEGAAPYAEQAVYLLRKYSEIINAELKLDKSLSAEEYSVCDIGNTVVIAGGSASGIIFGAGRIIRNPLWRGRSAPEKKIRGIYFATHFENWYDHASFEELDGYLENLAIWGCNAVQVWFDMHQYTGINDPAAQKKIERLRHIFRKADSLGMMNCLITLANEAFAGSPEELRADWTSGHDGYKYALSGHYHLELCPSKPGAMELLMKWRGEVLEAFAGCNIRYVTMNPYDQGGCSCHECAPFGAGGYLKILPEFTKTVHKYFPDAEVIADTWRFDVFCSGEWDGFSKNANEIAKYSKCVLMPAEDLEKLSMLPEEFSGAVFMEISMDRNLPWGGFGANPMPGAVNDMREKMRNKRIAGSLPYSEGIYEDINKIMILASEWDMSQSSDSIIREYAAFYFGQEHSDDILKAVMLMEENYGHSAVILQDGAEFSAYSIQNTNPDVPWEIACETPNIVPEKAEECFSILEKVREKLPREIAASERWKLLYLRGKIDFLIAGKDNGSRLEEAFLELYDLYHCIPETMPCLMPPSAEKWGRAIRERRSGRV